MTPGRTAGVWDRRAWAAGIVFVVALLAEAALSAGLPINQDDSAAKTRQLQDHRHTVLVAAYLSAVYAVAFVIYLAKLHDFLRRVSTPPGALHSLVLIGGVLLVALHGGQRHRDLRPARREDRDLRRTSRPRPLLHPVPLDVRARQRGRRLRERLLDCDRTPAPPNPSATALA